MTQQPDVFALPGQPLSSAGSFIPGHGTHFHAGQICASLAGRVHRASNGAKDGKNKSQKSQAAVKPIIHVLPLGSKLPVSSSSSPSAPPKNITAAAAAVRAPPRQPDITSGVLARVTRITPRHAQVDILCLSPPTSTTSTSTSTATTTTTTSPSSADSSTPSLPYASQNYIPLSAPYPTGLIRAQDIRATPLDTIPAPGGSIISNNISGNAGSNSNNNSNSSWGIILNAFRIGDIVRAVVISMGDQQHYYLSTVADELGVVLAVSADHGGGGGGGSGGTGMEKAKGGNLMYPVSWREMRDPVTGVTESRKVARPF